MLPPFGEKLGAKTKDALEKLGVEVQLGAMVTDVDERGLVVQDKDGTQRRIEAVTKIWAAGVQASPLGEMLAEQSGAALDRAGRIGVNPDLTLPGYPEVFVVGDMIALNNLPGVAQVAIQGAKYAAKEIKGRLKGKAAAEAVQVLRQGQHGHDLALRRGRHGRQAPDHRVHRLADVARRPPDLPDRVQEPGDRAAALGGHLPLQRPLRAHRHRAADLRADGAQAAAGRGAGPGQRTRRFDRPARRARGDAAEEARLTDSGERGRVSDRTA